MGRISIGGFTLATFRFAFTECSLGTLALTNTTACFVTYFATYVVTYVVAYVSVYKVAHFVAHFVTYILTYTVTR